MPWVLLPVPSFAVFLILHSSNSTMALLRTSYRSCSSIRCDNAFSGAVMLRRSFVSLQRRPTIGLALRSSLSSDPQSRCALTCFDQPCAPPLPCDLICSGNSDVDRDVNVERWMNESLLEIVRNIQEAPFLQFVCKGKLGKPQRQKVSQDLFENAEYWPSIRKSLSEVDPDGIILVQKLSGESTANCCLAGAFQSVKAQEVVSPLYQLTRRKRMYGEYLYKQEEICTRTLVICWRQQE